MFESASHLRLRRRFRGQSDPSIRQPNATGSQSDNAFHRTIVRMGLGVLLAGWLGGSTLIAQPAEVTLSAPVVTIGEFWLLDTDPNHDALRVNVAFDISRNQPDALSRDIPIRFNLRLVDSSPGNPTVGNLTQTETVSVPPVADFQVSFDLELLPDSILSQAVSHTLHLTLSHDDDPPSGEFQFDHAVTDGPHTIAHFNGALSFGALDTAMNELALPPAPLAPPNTWRLVIQQGELSNGTPFSSGVPPSTPHLDVVRNDTDGSASVVDGSVLVQPADPDFSINGWSGRLGRVVLDASGLEAVSFTLELPEGTGWRFDDTDPGTPQTLHPVFTSQDTPLPVNEDLVPIATVSGTFSGPLEFVDERWAIGFVGTSWSWNLETLRLDQPVTRFQRQWHYDQWKAVKGDLPDSNDGYLDQLALLAQGHLHIQPGIDGGFSAELALEAGEFSTHFPHGYIMHPGGILRLVNSLPDTTGSGLNAATAAILTYTGCRAADDPHALPDPATQEAVVVGPATVRFTAQGSLWTEGVPVATLPGADITVVRRAAAGQDPSSGLPIHETANYIGQNVQILVPGATVPHATGIPGGFNPARWLYTGLRPDDDDALEYPGTPAYLLGAADYAGVNFRHFPGLTGISRIGGGVMGPYDLGLCQKLYARASGLTGRWAADETTLPPSIAVGGPDPFLLTLDQWAFQLLANEPQFDYSAVAGSVTLPYPAHFSLAFDSIEFGCCGNLDKVSLAGGEAVRSLAYWGNARIAIQSARFVSADDCSMEDSCLELHVRARVNGFPQDLDGILLFRGSGRMTTGLDDPHSASALHASNGSPFMGDYYITPARHLFYNDPGPVTPPNPIVPGDGFIAVAGHLKLPFFEAMESHAILTGIDLPPEANPNLIPGLRRGWSDAGQTYFNNATFDAAHRGLPPAFDTAFDYIATLNEDYLPRASRTWFGKIPFNFPVVFDPPTRHFHSVEKKEIDVIIAQAEADVPRLNHEQAAINFGITVGLSLNNLFSDVLAFATGQLVEGFANLAIGPALDQISDGLQQLDGLLSLQARDALGDAILPELDGLISQAAQQIRSGATVQTALGQINFNPALQGNVASATAGHVTGKLGPIANGLQGMRGFLAPGEETQIGQFMQQALGFLNLPPGMDSFSVAELIELAELESGPVRDRLEELRERMEELRNIVQNVTGLDTELQGLLTGANAEFTSLQQAVRGSLEDYFEMVHANPASFTQAEIEVRIRNEIEDRLWAMPVVQQVQNVLRFRFYHFDHLIRQVVSSALDQINRAITDLVAEAVDLDGLLNDLTGIGGYVQAVSLKGEAIITGNDLTYLSLKGKTTLQIEPIPIDFHPFYEYQQLHSDGANGCDPEAQPVLFNRITMGATVAPARMPLGDVSVTISTQFSFTEDGRVIGFMGGFEFLTEGLGMQPVNFDRINALLHIGGNSFAAFEFYMAAEGHATVFASPSPVQLPWSNFKLHGGFFAGRTCTDLPYAAWVPPNIMNLLPAPPFTGAIAAVDGKFPFVDVGCMLRLKAGATIGAWGLVMQDNFDLGAFLEGRVSGRFLCIVSADGSIQLHGQATKDSALLKGAIEAKIKAGPCPFCLKLDAGIGVTLATPGGISVDL